MNDILSLQRLAMSVPVDGDEDIRSSQSICCVGSTASGVNCCNVNVD